MMLILTENADTYTDAELGYVKALLTTGESVELLRMPVVSSR